MDLRVSSIKSSNRGAPAVRHLIALSMALFVGSAFVGPDAHAASDVQGSAKASVKKTAGQKAQQSAKKRSGGHKAATAAAAAAPIAVMAADERQMEASRHVHEGVSQCEFNQQVRISASQQYPGYVDLSFKNKQWLMKPVVSSTGALRLEDVRAETLFIQIRDKSMLMNQKTGQRLVDGCVHANQKQAMTGN